MGYVIVAVLAFIVGFALAAEIGRQIYNRKMDEIQGIAKNAREYLASLQEGQQRNSQELLDLINKTLRIVGKSDSPSA